MKIRKEFLGFIGVLFFTAIAHAQVGVGTLNPNQSSQLDITATDKGLLIPRIKLTQSSSQSPVIGSAAISLLVYNTATENDVAPGFYYWNGTKWVKISDKADIDGFKETITTLKNNGDGTYSYINESGNITVIDIAGSVKTHQTLTSLFYNSSTQVLTFRDENELSNEITLTGITGPQGPAGANGADGAAGPQGLQGFPGTAGTNGIDGKDFKYEDFTPLQLIALTGPQGPAGANGTDGAAGPQGLQGFPGAAGTNGIDGKDFKFEDFTPSQLIALTGAQGPAGANGADGAAGPQGLQGFPGAAGTNGIDGKDFKFEDFTPSQLIALTGPQGPAGANGADGAAGPQGLQGFPGAAGTNGIDGKDFKYEDFTPLQLVGLTGPQGPAGTNGTDGVNGIDGKDFKYEDFTPLQLAGLTGPQGPAGADGSILTADNGLNKSAAANIQLGGTLLKPTEISTNATNTLAISGLQQGTDTDNLVAVSPSTGILKTVNTAAPKFFYAPSVVLPLKNSNLQDGVTYDPAGEVFTVNLYSIYSAQFGMTGDIAGASRTAIKSPGATTLPIVAAASLEYFVTYFDNTVFDPTAITLSDTGIMTYKVLPSSPVTEKTYMNITFKVK